MLKLALLTLCILHLTTAMPSRLIKREKERRHKLEALDDSDDNESMGSHLRGTRAAPSNEGAYYKSDEREGNGEIGYSRKKSGGGKKGYQHFDSFHKKAGDNYEFEKQDSYGLEKDGQDGAYSHRHEKKVKKDREQDSSEQLRELEDFDEEDEAYRQSPRRKQKEPKHAELREGAEDGNGGVEAFGHDPKDYILPEKYIYGKEADPYDF